MAERRGEWAGFAQQAAQLSARVLDRVRARIDAVPGWRFRELTWDGRWVAERYVPSKKRLEASGPDELCRLVELEHGNCPARATQGVLL